MPFTETVATEVEAVAEFVREALADGFATREVALLVRDSERLARRRVLPPLLPSESVERSWSYCAGAKPLTNRYLLEMGARRRVTRNGPIGQGLLGRPCQ